MGRYDEPYDYTQDEDDFNLAGKIIFALVSTSILVLLLSFNSCINDEIERQEKTDPAPPKKEIQYATEHYNSSLSECTYHWYNHFHFYK